MYHYISNNKPRSHNAVTVVSFYWVLVDDVGLQVLIMEFHGIPAGII